MNSKLGKDDREYLDLVFLYSLQALPASEMQAVEAHISSCADCRHEIETLRPTTDLLRPSVSLWGRLAERIGEDTGEEMVSPPSQRPAKPEWEEAVPGISCKLLAIDTDKNRVSMLVRLAPGAEYPPHRHAGEEELYLLYGELMIDDKKLYPGDYIRAEANSADHRVWSETGCTCVLLTSTKDVLF
jgi:quercetin dioxygenase-like cupin family protein